MSWSSLSISSSRSYRTPRCVCRARNSLAYVCPPAMSAGTISTIFKIPVPSRSMRYRRRVWSQRWGRVDRPKCAARFARRLRQNNDGSIRSGQVLRDLNELLCDDLTEAELFITMFYFSFLPETRTLKYANAGHNFALLLRSGDDTCTPLDAEGLVLGVVRVVDFEERSVQLSIGDKLLLYTDGVTEAQNPQGDFLGLDRLCEAFSAYRTLAPEALIRQLFNEVRGFCGKFAPQRRHHHGDHAGFLSVCRGIVTLSNDRRERSR